MSYARSPRPVCSMPMGTNIIRASFSLTSLTPPRGSRVVGGLKALRLRGLAVQKIEGLLVADPVPDSIQRSITCQTSADRIRRLIGLSCQSFNLAVNFLVADVDFFLISDLFEQQGSLHFLQRLFALAHSHAREVHFFHIFGAHALRRQSAKPALESNVNLALH